MSNPWGNYLEDAHEESSLQYLLDLIEDQDEDDQDELEEMSNFLDTMTVNMNHRRIKWGHEHLDLNEHVESLQGSISHPLLNVKAIQVHTIWVITMIMDLMYRPFVMLTFVSCSSLLQHLGIQET
jgi:hypothetical protein